MDRINSMSLPLRVEDKAGIWHGVWDRINELKSRTHFNNPDRDTLVSALCPPNTGLDSWTRNLNPCSDSSKLVSRDFLTVPFLSLSPHQASAK